MLHLDCKIDSGQVEKANSIKLRFPSQIKAGGELRLSWFSEAQEKIVCLTKPRQTFLEC